MPNPRDFVVTFNGQDRNERKRLDFTFVMSGETKNEVTVEINDWSVCTFVIGKGIELIPFCGNDDGSSSNDFPFPTSEHSIIVVYGKDGDVLNPKSSDE